MDAYDSSLLNLLRCPREHSGLGALTPNQLNNLNELIRSRKVGAVNGQPVTDELESGLINSEQNCAYRIRDGIIQLIADEAILLDQTI